ncbi:ly6/PLAUR domain-containing protein 6B isoform X5 [Gallus gallus]|uniref:ly6/PLAUR domain-containing protein 6B isoform X5 n=1 Tax=Gallus gallus TaxID=9031 RepID=UPI001AE38B4F|nr:ly6/PLAUR domain-containing protein 6B isoform X5 [Gallus gallus]XP_040560321.1 ly6/PLAUR domain-containing protein 6B isoform X5 [Gallus gallus]
MARSVYGALYQLKGLDQHIHVPDSASDFYFSRTIFSMLLFCHTLVGAFLPLFLLSGNWVSAKNINFYNVRPPLDLLSALPVIMRWTITTVTDGLKIGGVLKVRSTV